MGLGFVAILSPIGSGTDKNMNLEVSPNIYPLPHWGNNYMTLSLERYLCNCQ